MRPCCSCRFIKKCFVINAPSPSIHHPPEKFCCLGVKYRKDQGQPPPFPKTGAHLGAADAPLPAAAAGALPWPPSTIADGIKGQEAPHAVSNETHLEKVQRDGNM